jgi:hypothetical protein
VIDERTGQTLDEVVVGVGNNLYVLTVTSDPANATRATETAAIVASLSFQ